jgi:TPR repeat protein
MAIRIVCGGRVRNALCRNLGLSIHVWIVCVALCDHDSQHPQDSVPINLDAHVEHLALRQLELDMETERKTVSTSLTSPPPAPLQTVGLRNPSALSAFAGFVPSSSSALAADTVSVAVPTQPSIPPPAVLASAPFFSTRTSQPDLVQPSAPAAVDSSRSSDLARKSAPIPDPDPVRPVLSSVTAASSGAYARNIASIPAIVPPEKVASTSASVGGLSKSSKPSWPNTRPCRFGSSCRYQDTCTFVHPAATSSSATTAAPILKAATSASTAAPLSTSSKSASASLPPSSASAKSSQPKTLSVAEQFQAMNIKQIKEFLSGHGVDFKDCANKVDFVALCIRVTQSAHVSDARDSDSDSEVDDNDEDAAELKAAAAASRAAAMAGKSPQALLEYGYASKAQGNLELAAECFAKAAEAKRNTPVGARFAYAMCVYEGEGVLEDKDAAISLLVQAADTEQCPQALSWLGIHYEKGRNRRISKDLALAFNFFKRCVAFKLPPPNKAPGSATVTLASLQQSAVASAQFRLHKYFLNGTGGCCEANPRQAQVYFDLALANGSSDALAAMQVETNAKAQEERRAAREAARAREREARDRARKAEEERQWAEAAQRREREREQREAEQRQREVFEQRHPSSNGHHHHDYEHGGSSSNSSFYDDFFRKMIAAGAVQMRMGPNGPEFCVDPRVFGFFGHGHSHGGSPDGDEEDGEDGYEQEDDGYVGNIFANMDEHLPPHERFRRKYLSSAKVGSYGSSASHFVYDATREAASFSKIERDQCIQHVNDHATDAPHVALCLTDAEISAAVTSEVVVSSIKKHYRVLSLLVHPDKNKENDAASDAFVALGVAQEKMLHCWR